MQAFYRQTGCEESLTSRSFGGVDKHVAAEKIRAIFMNLWASQDPELSEKEFADKLGIDRSYVNNISHRRAQVSAQIGQKMLDRFPKEIDAAELNVLFQHAMGVPGATIVKTGAGGEPRVIQRPEEAGLYHVVGRVSCGSFDELLAAEPDRALPPPSPLKKPIRARWLEAWGDSMTGEIQTDAGPVRILPGDLLWAVFDERPKSGQVALVAMNGQLTVKLWKELTVQDGKKKRRIVELVPTNRNHPTRTFEDGDERQLEACRIAYVDPKPRELP